MDTCALPRWHGYETHSLHPWTNEKALCNLDGGSFGEFFLGGGTLTSIPPGRSKSKPPSSHQDKLWILDWRTFFCDFFFPPLCPNKIDVMFLNCSFGASQRAAKRTYVRQTFIWARGGDVDTGCMVCPKGAIASEKQKRDLMYAWERVCEYVS